MPSRDPTLTAAYTYAARGWPVFWLGRSKRPVANCRACRTAPDDHDPAACGCLTCHGFYAATTDPARIAAIRRAVPYGTLAIRTGSASGLVVVDIDPRNGGHLDRELMHPTATVATGGNGWHLYYAHPGQPVASRTLPDRAGVDIKGDGGYVAAPPAIHPTTGRAYRWADTRPIEEMAPALRAAIITAPPTTVRPASPASPMPTVRGAGAISNPAALLAANLAAVARAPIGRRRRTLYGATRGIARMVAAGAVSTGDAIGALTDAGRRAEQSERDIHFAITGGFRDEGVTI